MISANGDSGVGGAGGVSRSVPTSPGDRNKTNTIPVAGSAENLVGRVSLKNYN